MLPRLILLDADGTVWRGNTVIGGAPEFICRAQAAGVRCLLLSNNAGPDRPMYFAKCRSLGLDFAEADIYSVNHLAGPFVAQRFPCTQTLVVGSEALVASMRPHTAVVSAEAWLAEHGLPGQGTTFTARDLDELHQAHFDNVLVGIDLNVNYFRLALACAAVEHGARLLGANQDPTFPIEDGLELPGNGSLVRLIANTAGVEPLFLGKPELHLVEQIEQDTGISRSAMLMVGDRIETDIVMAQRAGMPSVLVLTGVDTAAGLDAGMRQVSVAQDLKALAEQLGI